MVYLKQSLSIAAYEGVRTAIGATATTADVQNTCNQILLGRNVVDPSVTLTPANFDHSSPGEYVDVTVSAPCDKNTVVPNAFYKGKTLSSTASMMIEFRPFAP